MLAWLVWIKIFISLQLFGIQSISKLILSKLTKEKIYLLENSIKGSELLYYPLLKSSLSSLL